MIFYTRLFLKKVLLILCVSIVALHSLFSFPSVARAGSVTDVYLAQSNASQGSLVENLVARVQALFVRQASARPPAGRRKGGAGRGRRCPATKFPISALVPSWSDDAANFPNEISRIVAPEFIYGTTTLPNPTVLVYVPYAADSAQAAKFMLLDESGHQVISEPILIELPQSPGIVSFQFPEVLEVGHLYNWYFSVVCDEQKPSRNPGVRGWIQRIEPSQTLIAALAQTDESTAFDVYAASGIWFESVSLLAQAYRLNQTDATVQRQWAELLNALGLATPEEMPLVREYAIAG